MKILQVITTLQVGGAETLVVNLTQRMRRMGHQVDVCVFDGKETALMKRLETECPGVKIFKLGQGVYNPLYIWKLIHIMKQYYVVHTHNSSPQLFVAIAKLFCKKVKLVSTEHTTSNRKRNWKWYAPIESWMYGQYNHVICISDIAEKKLRDYMGGDWTKPDTKTFGCISTINNGVDVQGLHNAKADEDLVAKKEDRIAILMVAGFRDAKDQDTIVRALSILGSENYEVWFAGAGVRQPEVKVLSKELKVADRVRFLGMRTDIPNVLNAADVIVMSSHWEGLSLANIEGMSVNKPFIASDVDGLRQVTDGYGILFPHADEKVLAATIQKLHDDPEYYQQIATKCYERALQYDINKTVDGYLAVYDKVMGN